MKSPIPVVIVSRLLDGEVIVFGPFPSSDEAREWAKSSSIQYSDYTCEVVFTPSGRI